MVILIITKAVFPNLILASTPFSDKQISIAPPTIPSTHINTIFLYCTFGMFENDQNKNERKDAFHYTTSFSKLTHLAVGNC